MKLKVSNLILVYRDDEKMAIVGIAPHSLTTLKKYQCISFKYKKDVVHCIITLNMKQAL